MAAAPRAPSRPLSRDITEQTVLGKVYMRSLLRVQFRLGATLLGIVAGTVGAVPALFAVLPGLAGVRVLGIGLPWLVLGVAVHPVLLATAWWYVRLTERAERDFTDLLSRH
jgi:hypothetical protein